MAVPYYGDYPEDHEHILIPFNTFTSDDPSASCTITDLADADIHVHKDGSVDEIVADGATVAINFDGVTGNHLVIIDSSVDAAYAAGSEYTVRIEGTTIDGATINAWIGAFSIERAGGVLALIKAGSLGSNVTHIGGDSVAGNAATLTLKQLDIQNSDGTALVAKSTGSGGYGMDIAGNLGASGFRSVGGATGSGIEAVGGSTSGNGIYTHTPVSGHGIYSVGADACHGLFVAGGTTGDGLKAQGGGTSGAGIVAIAPTNGSGISITGATDGHGIAIAGAGSGDGIFAIGGDTGHGLEVKGGGTSGDGIHAEASTEGDGIYALGKGTDEHGILAVGGDTSGDGIHANATAGNGNGMSLVKHGTGKDIDADEIDNILTLSNSSAAWGYINSGIVFRGIATAGDTTHATIGGLAGQGAGAFVDVNTPWYLYVFRDAGGIGGAPQGETRTVSAYDNATGEFTVSAVFTAAIAAGDDCIIMSGRIAAIPNILSMLDDARNEPGDEAPPVDADAMTKLDYLYKFMRNKIETTATKINVYDDAGTNKDHTSTISDDGTTFTRGEFSAGE